MGEVIPFRKKQESEVPEVFGRKFLADIDHFRAQVLDAMRQEHVANLKYDAFAEANDCLKMFEESARDWSHTVDRHKDIAVLKGLYDEYMEAKKDLKAKLGIQV